MHALIADVTIAEIPEPVPVVMDEVPMKRLLRRRAKPEIEIQVGRRRLDRFESDAPARFAAVAFRDEQPAVLAALNQRRQRRTAAGAALRAMLNHALVVARSLDTLPPFEHVMAAGLLDVHVLPRLAGPDGNQGMPVVRRRDGNRIHVLALEQFPDVLIFPDAFKVLSPAIEDVAINVA